MVLDPSKHVASQILIKMEYLCYVLVLGSNASTTVQIWNIMQMRQFFITSHDLDLQKDFTTCIAQGYHENKVQQQKS